MRSLTVLATLLLVASVANAEDWTTTDGRIYKDIKIEHQDAVSVTISDSDGGAVVPLSILPTELQKQLGYDPEKATAFEKAQEAKRLEFIRQQDARQQESVERLKKLFAQIFSSPIDSAVLYSLEPWEDPKKGGKKLYRFKILGKTALDSAKAQLAANAIQKAAADWSGNSALCFDPRHALRVSAKGHVYDFLICFECEAVYFYEGGKTVGSSGASGSPESLNSLLTAAHVPLSQSGVKSADAEKLEQQKQKDEEARSFAAMPKSIQAKWDWTTMSTFPSQDVPLFRGLVIHEYPEVGPRILKLLEWYGSGAGAGSGLEAPSLLLFDYPTQTILDAVQSTNLNDSQIEGTARFFGSWNFSQKRPKDLSLLPAELKRALLAHCLKSGDDNKKAWAKRAFQH